MEKDTLDHQTLRALFRDVKRTKLDFFLADKIASATITTETTIAVIKEEMLSVTELYIPTSYHLATITKLTPVCSYMQNMQSWVVLIQST